MKQDVVSMREMQRSYRKILERARRTRHPVFLGVRGKAEAALMHIEDFRRFEGERTQHGRAIRWAEIERALDRIAAAGRKEIIISKFIHEDRKAH